MPAYMVAQIDIEDPDEYQKYLDGFMPIFQRHGGELLVFERDGTEILEGEWEYPGTVIMKFPSVAAAEDWYRDPDYKALAIHRHRSSRANLVLVDGVG